MDSQSIYNTLLDDCKNRFYAHRYFIFIEQCIEKNLVVEPSEVERHHFLPSSLYPEVQADPSNIVKLSSRQHFLCHYMLAKAFGGKMSYAFWSMCNQKGNDRYKRSYRFSSNTYESARKHQKQRVSESRKNKIAITNGHKIKWVHHNKRLPSGWRYGLPERIGVEVSNRVSRSIWITNGSENKRIQSNQEIPQGWYAGRINENNKINEYRTCFDLLSKRKFRNHKDYPVKEFATSNIEQKHVYELKIDGIIYCHSNQKVFLNFFYSVFGCKIDVSPTRIDYHSKRNSKCTYFPNTSLSELGLSFQHVNSFQHYLNHKWIK